MLNYKLDYYKAVQFKPTLLITYTECIHDLQEKSINQGMSKVHIVNCLLH